MFTGPLNVQFEPNIAARLLFMVLVLLCILLADVEFTAISCAAPVPSRPHSSTRSLELTPFDLGSHTVNDLVLSSSAKTFLFIF